MQIKQTIVATATAASMAISLFVPMLAVHAAAPNPFDANVGKAVTNLKQVGQGAGIESSRSPMEIVGSIINIALSLLGLIFLVLALYAGFKWMTAQGDTKEVDAAKDTLKNSVIGLIIIMASYALSTFVITQLAGVTQ